MKYILILMLLSTSAFASGDRNNTTNNTYNNTSIEDAKGVAVAIASAQHHFDYGTYSWQGSVGVGAYAGEEAISFGIAKRVGKMLLTSSVTSSSVGVGFNWRF